MAALSRATTRRVLLVEDEEELRRVWKRLATLRQDFELVAVPTVAEAQRALASGAFDLVVCDFHLAVGTTEGLVRSLVRLRQLVVVLTGDGAEARAALSDLPVPILDKPTSLAGVLARAFVDT